MYKTFSKRIPVFFLKSTFVFVLFGCSVMTYAPKISLDVSPKTIPGVLKVEKFIDKSPESDKRHGFGGSSLTNPEALTSELSLEVTNEIVSDFSKNAVFEITHRKPSIPENFTMTGEINKFKIKSSPTTYGIISTVSYFGIITWLFGFPLRKNEVEIDLSILISDAASKRLIKKYSSSAYYRSTSGLYKSNDFAITSEANKALSKVVSDIRKKIISDIHLYTK